MKKIFTTFTLSIVLLIGAILPSLAYASSTTSRQEVCQGVGVITQTSGCASHKTSGESINSILRLTLNLFSAIVGVIAIFMIIIGGLKYILSSGNSEKTNEAKNSIMYAAIGLVIVALAQIVVKFILNKSNGL
jgi:cytochrome bd-type quinol oxidase subunit 2